MTNLSPVLTAVSMATCLAVSTTAMSAGNQANIGFTNSSGATYINSSRYTTGGTGTNIGADIPVTAQLGLVFGYRAAKLNAANNVKYTDIGMKFHLDAATSTYFSANKASVFGNSETLFMLGARRNMSLGGASGLAFKLGTSTSNLFDDLEYGVDFSTPLIDALELSLGYQAKVTSLAKTSTKATSSGFSMSINSRF
tara:strand:+ start:576 stop:1166 length:591 start_codon:yes stop_codon:yes gene_type:complete